MFWVNVTQYVKVLRGAYPTSAQDTVIPKREKQFL